MINEHDAIMVIFSEQQVVEVPGGAEGHAEAAEPLVASGPADQHQ